MAITFSYSWVKKTNFMGKKKELPDLFAMLKVSPMAVINIDFKRGLSFLLTKLILFL